MDGVTTTAISESAQSRLNITPADDAIVSEQLGELRAHEREVAAPVAVVGAAVVPRRPPAGPVVGVMPVELRVIEEELDAGRMAGVGELLQGVPLERRPVDDVVGRLRSLEHREAVVMAR